MFLKENCLGKTDVSVLPFPSIDATCSSGCWISEVFSMSSAQHKMIELCFLSMCVALVEVTSLPCANVICKHCNQFIFCNPMTNRSCQVDSSRVEESRSLFKEEKSRMIITAFSWIQICSRDSYSSFALPRQYTQHSIENMNYIMNIRI